jgi:hypothetical protein
VLVGATPHIDSDPYDKTSPPITVGPRWMIMWPIDPKATGLPTTHCDEGAYTMWVGSPYAHLHVMGHPDGAEISERMWPPAAFTWGSQS